MPDYSDFLTARNGIGRIEDGPTYLRNLLKDEAGGPSLAESLISRIKRNEVMDIPAEFFAAGGGWLQMIKALRSIYGISIAQAHDLALRHPGWLRWVKQRCMSDRSCMKQARHAARTGSLPDWLVLEDGRVRFVR